MKSVAIMQPYLFPYIGYFQLINAVDLFIIYDDVQWIKGGWINRNRILIDNQAEYITLPVKKDSMSKSINERRLGDNAENEKQLLLDSMKATYKKAPYFNETIKAIEKILSCKEKNMAVFIENSLRVLCNSLGVDSSIIKSSSIEKSKDYKAQERVVDICRLVNADSYINAIGGQDLYESSIFAKNGIALSFLKSIPLRYKQFDDSFIPNLSIIDVMMFNDVNTIKNMLGSYELT